MNLRYEILKACAANPGAPVDEIADAIKHDRKKTGWAVRDCAKEGLLSKRLDDVTGQLGRVYSATLDEKKVAVDMQIYSKWERMLASLYFGNATLLIDCDADDFSYGLYD
jgi:hypothetical protein